MNNTLTGALMVAFALTTGAAVTYNACDTTTISRVKILETGLKTGWTGRPAVMTDHGKFAIDPAVGATIGAEYDIVVKDRWASSLINDAPGVISEASAFCLG